MNKVLLPTILVVTALAAGIVALSPVDDATAVHTTIIDAGLTNLETTFTVDWTVDVNLNCANDFLVHYFVYDADATVGGENFLIDFDDDTIDDLTINVIASAHNGGLSGTFSVIAGQTGELDGNSLDVEGYATAQCQDGDTILIN